LGCWWMLDAKITSAEVSVLKTDLLACFQIDSARGNALLETIENSSGALLLICRIDSQGEARFSRSQLRAWLQAIYSGASSALGKSALQNKQRDAEINAARIRRLGEAISTKFTQTCGKITRYQKLLGTKAYIGALLFRKGATLDLSKERELGRLHALSGTGAPSSKTARSGRKHGIESESLRRAMLDLLNASEQRAAGTPAGADKSRTNVIVNAYHSPCKWNGPALAIHTLAAVIACGPKRNLFDWLLSPRQPAVRSRGSFRELKILASFFQGNGRRKSRLRYIYLSMEW